MQRRRFSQTKRLPRPCRRLCNCSDPTIKFAAGLDDRQQKSFESNHLPDFNHGSALSNGVIANFICSQLQNKCKASDSAVAACTAGKTAANSKIVKLLVSTSHFSIAECYYTNS